MFIAVLLAAALSGTPIYGVARAGDGDSLTIGQTRVRLFGIDAPEFDQQCQRGGTNWPCGQTAAAELAALVTGREVRCMPTGLDQHGRVVARCSVGSVDVNRTMVARGYAIAFRRYSTDYVSAEESAKLTKRGIWSGTFTMPSEVRAASRSDEVSASPRRGDPVRSRPVARATGACAIKGNRSRRGEWIYHLPGMPYYDQTRPEELFCTEAEARAAGYRRAVVR